MLFCHGWALPLLSLPESILLEPRRLDGASAGLEGDGTLAIHDATQASSSRARKTSKSFAGTSDLARAEMRISLAELLST